MVSSARDRLNASIYGCSDFARSAWVRSFVGLNVGIYGLSGLCA